MSEAFYNQVGNSIATYLFQELKLKPNYHYKVASALSGPRVLTMNLLLNPTYASKITRMSEALSMAAGLDRDISIRISRGKRGSLAFEIPKPKDEWFNIGVGNLPRRRGLLASVGLDSEHRPTMIDFGDPLTPHTLLAGSTGSGKTNCLKLLTYGLASQNTPDQVEFLLIDTRKRGVNWKAFSSLPHLAHPVITSDEMALKALTWACAEIDRRASNGKRKPHVFIGLDECQDLLDRQEYVKAIGDIAATGREFGIHCLAATQNPTSKQLGDSTLKRNLACRLVGRCDSGISAHVATGQAESGAEKLTGSGDMLLIQPLGIRRLTAALLTERDTQALPYSENARRLDLGQFQDLDHVVNQKGRKAEPLEPAHVAVALTAKRGINWLASELGIGSGRAKKVLDFAKLLHTEIENLGYTVIPHTNDIPI